MLMQLGYFDRIFGMLYVDYLLASTQETLRARHPAGQLVMGISEKRSMILASGFILRMVLLALSYKRLMPAVALRAMRNGHASLSN